MICGNLGGAPIPGFKTHKVVIIDDKKILITAIIDKRLEGKAIHGLKVKDPLTSLKKILKIPHDLAIVILHLSDNRARKLLQETSGLDIAVLATQRGILRDREIINGCRIIKNNNHGKTIGYLDWSFTKNSLTANKILAINKETYPADKKVSLLVDEHETWLRKHYIELEKNKTADLTVDTPYVGKTECAACHPQIVNSWKKTKHAKAYATLKKKCKDYCPDCLPCHSTGSFAHYKKGFRSPATTPHLFKVQCEECHGAAQEHIKNPALPYGNTINAGVCIICHTTNTDPEFSYPEDKKLISH
jgi:mono/diheme cytochrome c family protein